MPTELQKEVFKEVVKQKLAGKRPVVSKIAREKGASPSYARLPQMITKSKGWQELLAKYEDEPLTDRLYDIALGGDRRASLQAIKELFTLKDRYPAQKSQVVSLYEKLSDLADKPEAQGNADNKEGARKEV